MAGAVPLVAGLSLPDRILHSAWRREKWADPVCQVAPLLIGHEGMTGKVGVRYTSKNAGGRLLAFAMGMRARWLRRGGAERPGRAGPSGRRDDRRVVEPSIPFWGVSTSTRAKDALA
jgi:hypothetical protein